MVWLTQLTKEQLADLVYITNQMIHTDWLLFMAEQLKKDKNIVVISKGESPLEYILIRRLN